MLVWLKWTSIVFLVVLAVIQVFRSAKTASQIDPISEIHSNLVIPAGVTEVLQRSCNDCDANRTVWLWYTGWRRLAGWLFLT